MNKFMMIAAMAIGGCFAANAEDWAARIDGNVYLNQLSIPGAHDCATGHGFKGFLGILAGSSSAVTQSLTLSQQWDCGVRAFDLRPTVNSGSLEIYHGVCQTKLGFSTALTTLCGLLDEHPTEFAIVLMRHETDGDNNDSSWAGKVTEVLSSAPIASHIIAYAPDLTLDQVRGKIIILSRDSFESPYAGFISGWSHSADFASQKNASITSAQYSGRLYVQDFYECTDSGADETKMAAVKEMYKFSATLCQPGAPANVWVVNHTSGYTKSASSDGNRNLAAKANSALIDCLADASISAGPTGIVLMDFAGVDESNKYAVNGLALVNAIISHNSRYTMRMAEGGGSSEPAVLEPKEATDELIYWHSITAARRESKVLTHDEAANILLGTSADETNPGPESQWKLTKRANGTFNIINRQTGAYISPVGAVYNTDIPMSYTEPSAGWRIKPTGEANLYIIYSGSNVQFNQTQEVYQYHIFNWYASFPDSSDQGCLFRFRVVDEEEVEDQGGQDSLSEFPLQPETDAPVYDLSGRRVATPLRRPGIYITPAGKILRR